MDFEDEAEPPQSVWKRYRVGIIATAIVLVGIIVVARLASSGGSRKHEALTLVSLAPPPPPPVMTPPPPPPPQQEEQKMEQPMIKEEQPQEAPKNEPLSTGIKGDGPDSFGLSNKPGNGTLGPGGANGTKWRSYATQVQTRIQQALQQNRKTRSASLSVQVRVWPDPSGRIKRAQLASSTGNALLDAAIRDEVLTGLQLDQPPPADMPAPITLRLAARRP
jgi:outer membrane biosynthesis protein TonB